MSCDFKPGDEVVRVGCDESELMPGQSFARSGGPEFNKVYVVESVWRVGTIFALTLVGFECPLGGYDTRAFRKAQRKNARLAIETFMTMPGGFEEPKRKAPAKERVTSFAEQAGLETLTTPPDDTL